MARLWAGQKRNCGPIAGRSRLSVQWKSDVIASGTKRSELDANHFTSV